MLLKDLRLKAGNDVAIYSAVASKGFGGVQKMMSRLNAQDIDFIATQETGSQEFAQRIASDLQGGHKIG